MSEVAKDCERYPDEKTMKFVWENPTDQQRENRSELSGFIPDTNSCEATKSVEIRTHLATQTEVSVFENCDAQGKIAF